MTLIKLAIKARLPIVAASTRDTLNLTDVLKEITGETPVSFLPNGPWTEGMLYVLVMGAGFAAISEQNLNELYTKMTKLESTLLLVNCAHVVEPMFDAGEIPVPKPLLLKFMEAVTSSKDKAKTIIPGLGGCTIKEAAELAKLTMARDKSLTSAGLMETRKTSFQGARGLTQVDELKGFYDASKPLAAWAKREKKFFLTGADPRLRPRGLLFDGIPGTGKTMGAKWLAKELGVPLYRVDIGGTKNRYVGNSEANMLMNLQRLDEQEPAVALIDEVEKVFTVNNHDTSGTTSTMLGQLLWWLAEHQSRVLTIMTTNNAKSLPKELYREGRIDETMVFEGLANEDAFGFVTEVLATFGFTLEKHGAATLGSVATKIIAASHKSSSTISTKIAHAALTKATYDFIKAHNA
jgi:ATP-dependent 26S proteasome regulatory subunit